MHTICEDVKKPKHVKTIKVYKILIQIHLNYKFEKITFNKTTTTFHRLTSTNQRYDVGFSKLNAVVLLQSKGTTIEGSIGLLV